MVIDNKCLFFTFPESKKFQSPKCGVSLLSAGDVLPKTNSGNRADFFQNINLNPSRVLALHQIHSKKVYLSDEKDTFKDLPNGDGILTCNNNLIPTVVVADCMPIFFFEPKSGCFGVVHSGWAGTGIAKEAIDLVCKKYNVTPESFFVVLGPHIRKCCYNVTAERAEYFRTNFSEKSVSVNNKKLLEGSKWCYDLSLAEANIQLLSSIGVLQKNIVDTNLCTHCTKNSSGAYMFGSHRRETAEKHNGSFTHMVAFIYH